MKKFRISTLLVILVLCLSLLVGCSNAVETKEPKQEEAKEDVKEEASEDKEIEEPAEEAVGEKEEVKETPEKEEEKPEETPEEKLEEQQVAVEEKPEEETDVEASKGPKEVEPIQAEAGSLVLDGQFSLNGKNYKLPFKASDFAAIEGLEWDKKAVEDIAGLSYTTESFYLNKDQDNQVHIVAHIYNFTEETIKKEDGLICELDFYAVQGSVYKIPQEEWAKIITVDNGLTFNMDQKIFANTYQMPIKEQGGMVYDKDGQYTYAYKHKDMQRAAKNLEIAFTIFASENKDKANLKDMRITIDITDYAIEKTNEPK